MAIICLVGGKSVTNTSLKLEEYFLSLANKDTPKVLFCPYATINEIDKAKEKFYKQINGLKCDIHIMTYDDHTKFKELLDWCDVLYVNGGCCDELVKYFKDFNYVDLLNEFLNSNKVYVGISAGAMLPCIAGMGDKDAYLDNFKMHNYKMVNCLGLLDIVICPHYQVEELICFNDCILNYDKNAFGIENDTMIVINENKFLCIKSDDTRSAYYFDLNHQMIPVYDKEWKDLCKK